MVYVTQKHIIGLRLPGASYGNDVHTVADGGYIGSIHNYCFGLRPVVVMNEGVYIASGDGTEGNEYVLGKD